MFPKTIEAFKRCGLIVTTGRQETAAGHIAANFNDVRRGVSPGRKLLILRTVARCPEWPRTLDDATLAARVGPWLDQHAPALEALLSSAPLTPERKTEGNAMVAAAFADFVREG